MPASSTSRRTALRLVVGGIVLAGGVAGCSKGDPAVRPTSSPPPPPTPPGPPPPPPGLDAAIADESLALAWCRAIGEHRYTLSAAHLRNLALAADLHERRLVALALPSPETRPGIPAPTTSGSPSAGASPTTPATSVAPPTLPTVKLPGKQDAALKAFHATLGKVRTGHLDRAASADGPLALLWASLAAGATQTSAVVRRSTAVPAPPAEVDHRPYRVMTPAAAAQALLTQLHAIVFGYQVALAPLSGEASQPYRKRLSELQRQRDEVAELLRAIGAKVPAAEPEYDTGDPVTSDKAAVALIGRMEHALLPHLGNWVAAAEEDHRRTAAGWLGTTTDRAVRAGAAPSWWPGWPD